MVVSIRVRRHKLMDGGHPGGEYSARASTSYDLVRAVRVDGRRRHQLVLQLGSLKDRYDGSQEIRELVLFWIVAIRRMVKHGLADDQRRKLLTEMVRRGARLPTPAQCREGNWPTFAAAEIGELVRFIERKVF